MCGFLLGAAGFLALLGVVRCFRRCRRGGCGGHGSGGGGCGGHGSGGGGCGGHGGCGRGGGRSRWGHGCRGSGRWGHGCRGGGEPATGGERGRGRFFRFLFRRLRTTPGQERMLFEVADELQVKLDEARRELDGTRRELADVVRGEQFDEERVKALTTRQDELLRSLREALQAGLKKVHGVLEPEQRALLASLISRGPWAYLGPDESGPDEGPASV